MSKSISVVACGSLHLLCCAQCRLVMRVRLDPGWHWLERCARLQQPAAAESRTPTDSFPAARHHERRCFSGAEAQHRHILHHVLARRRGGRGAGRSVTAHPLAAAHCTHARILSSACRLPDADWYNECFLQLKLDRASTHCLLCTVSASAAGHISAAATDWRCCISFAPSRSRHPRRADVKKLVADNSTLSADALNTILRDYNTEQMTAAALPG